MHRGVYVNVTKPRRPYQQGRMHTSNFYKDHADNEDPRLAEAKHAQYMVIEVKHPVTGSNHVPN